MDTNAALENAKYIDCNEEFYSSQEVDFARSYIAQHAELAKVQEQLRVAVEAITEISRRLDDVENPVEYEIARKALQQIAALDAPIKEGV